VGVVGFLMFLLGLRTLEAPDPCGDPEVRLRLLAKGARQLAHNLAHFSNWWPAVKDKSFDGKLPDGRLTTHEWAMDTLLFMFAQFFSAAWTYQDNCHRHAERDEVKIWVDEVYKALGEDPGGASDASLMSTQLHTIAVRSTNRWGEADARPFQLADFKDEMDDNSRFSRDFKPLRTFLRAAKPETEARIRLEATLEAVRRVEEMLGERGYRP